MASAPSSPPWIPHLEAFVNPDNSPSQQAASLEAISSLVIGGRLTVQILVSDMEVFLTTTDNAVRARGIVLLAEILSCLKTEPLEDASIHSLTAFFTSRLADWQALRGAVIGCLALLKRKGNVGFVSTDDIGKLAKSYLENLQVQALRQEDRMLCLELLECLLDSYGDTIKHLGDDLVYGVVAAIDNEKDPRCLLLTFHIVELLVRLFPDEEGPLASCAEDLFDIISCYFPISFNPPPNDSLGITREDLSGALLRALMSSPLFASFCIPFLLEKLSSSLQVAKVDSLKYLGKCASSYGVDAISNHSKGIWESLKNEILSAADRVPDFAAIPSFRENEVVELALACVTECILAFHIGKNAGVLLQLLLEDEQMETIFKSVTSNVSGKAFPSKNESLQVHILGKLLSSAAKASLASCSVVSQRYLPRLVDIMQVNLDGEPGLLFASNQNNAETCSTTFSVLHICHQILEASRISAGHLTLQQQVHLDPNIDYPWLSLLRHLSDPIINAFASPILTHSNSSCYKAVLTIEDQIMHLGVAGLQALASFPGSFSPLSEDQYRNILLLLVSILLKVHDQLLLWERVLEALVLIGTSLEKFSDTTRILCFLEVVIVELLLQLSTENMSLPVSLNLKAVIAISRSNILALKQTLQGFRQVISISFLIAAIKQNNEGQRAREVVCNVLVCLSSEVLYHCQKMGVSEEEVMPLALDILNAIQEISAFNNEPPLQLLEATMEFTRVLVQYSSENLQKEILAKALDMVLPRLQSLPVASPVPYIANQEANFDLVDKPCREEWKIAFFASTVVALRPNISLHHDRKILEMFMSTILGKGHKVTKDTAAQALGSVINKYPVVANDNASNVFTLDEAIHFVLDECLLRILENHSQQKKFDTPQNRTLALSLGDIDVDPIEVQIQAVNAMAWIGKGLAMRGHNRISDVAMPLLNILRSSSNMFISSENDSYESGVDKNMAKISKVAEAAADGFGTIMKDSRTSLNKDCHALIRPLYKQRFFTSMIPVLLLAIKGGAASHSRTMLYRALGNLIFEAPHVALLAECDKVLPFILDGILVLSNNPENKDHLQSLLLSLSGIIVDEKKGKTVVVDHASTIISCLIRLVEYNHSMMVRETTLQSLGAMVALPYARIFPMRTQVLKAVSKVMDDRKRIVRKEAVRCHQAWVSIASN